MIIPSKGTGLTKLKVDHFVFSFGFPFNFTKWIWEAKTAQLPVG